MALKIGDDILDGKYRIEKALGEGAFSKVFLAQDQYLDRQVAVKELRREDWTEEQYVEFRRRFQREAQIGASLKHQNVVDVYTLERSGEDFCLVMEYVDGPSLQAHVGQQGALPVEEAVEVAIQLCEGLAAVHDHPLGIVHRDIKPSNILLTTQGQPKLTDFGLAQLHGESLRSLGKGARHPGTPAYMSPEQETSAGYLRPASDIYSLGCVLFEMLTGKVYKRVEGSRPSEWRPDVPEWLDLVLSKMLVHDWRSRYAEATEVKSELEEGLRPEIEKEAKVQSLLRRAEEALAAESWSQAIRICERGLELQPEHSRLSELLARAKDGETREADRKRGEKERRRRDRRRRVSQLAEAAKTRAKAVAGSFANHVGVGIVGLSVIACVVWLWLVVPPAWPPSPPPESPMRTTAASALPIATDTPDVQQTPAATPTASREPTTVPPPPPTATPRLTAMLLIPTPAPTASPTPGLPRPTPSGGGLIAFVHYTGEGDGKIYIMNADGRGPRRVTDMLLDDRRPSWSPDGTRIAFQSDRDGNWEVYSMNADGGALARLTTHGAYDGYPSWSRDGSRIAFASERDGNFEIYVVYTDGTGLMRLTNHAAEDFSPCWSPDGTRIVFQSDRDGDYDIYSMNADGKGVSRLTTHPAHDESPAWSPDGTLIAFESDRNGNREVYVMHVDGSGQANLTKNSASDQDPSWSPDSTAIVFSSNRDDVWNEVYVMKTDGTALIRFTAIPGYDGSPSWSPG